MKPLRPSRLSSPAALRLRGTARAPAVAGAGQIEQVNRVDGVAGIAR